MKEIRRAKHSEAIEIYQVRWSWDRHTERWCRRWLAGLFSLNMPCGMSQTGSIRADIDPSVHPDIICDLDNLPFRPGAFDFILCDPPFSFYGRFKWLIKLSDLSRHRILICTNGVVPRIRGYKRDLFATLQKGNFFVRHWVLYTKRNQEITNWSA